MMQLNDRDRDMVTDWLNGLAAENSGRLTPELIVTEAADPDSPGHRFLTWDNIHAAHKQRLNEARSLIRQVRVKVNDETIKIKSVAYVRDPSVDPKSQGYISTARLKSSKDLAREALRTEIKRAMGHMRRARQVAVDLGLEREFEEIFAQMEDLAN